MTIDDPAEWQDIKLRLRALELRSAAGVEPIAAGITTVLKGTIPQDGSPLRIHTNTGVTAADANGRFMLNTYFTKVLVAALGANPDVNPVLVVYDYTYNPGGAEQAWFKCIDSRTAAIITGAVRIQCVMFGF
jgi:hypothetical protein